jgi:ubiquinol-cytochrome c reductase iron-sulfur subunit
MTDRNAMTTHDSGSAGRSDVATNDGHAPLPERFDNPGLPDHRHRMADIDPKAAKRAERQVATLFGLSALGTVGTLVAYFAVKFQGNLSDNAYLQRVQLSNLLLGVGLFVSLFGIGAGAVHWAKTLMPDDERIELRHDMRGSDTDRADAVAMLKDGSAEAGLGRRPLIRNSLIGALALVPLPTIVLLRDTGPMPGTSLETTIWKKGNKLVQDAPGGQPLKASDLQIGSVAHVMPDSITDATPDRLEERAKAAVILIRLNPDLIDAAAQPGSYDGIVAYSKICTHMGCPVGLYEQQTHLLLCPCHQSTFDVTKNCAVIFGPAKRPLPQLAITVDADGYLVAKDENGFTQPVGPSFWERA